MKVKLYINNFDEPAIPELQYFSDYLAVLTPTTWDDFGYKVSFTLHIIDYSVSPPKKTDIGVIKLAFKDQSPAKSAISYDFYTAYFSKNINQRLLDSLPDNFFSLPEYDSYYTDIKNTFSNNKALVDQFFFMIKDVLINKLQEKIFTQDVFKKSLQRTMCFSSHEEFQWLYQRSKPLDIFNTQIEKANKILNANYQDFLEDEIYIMLHGFLIAALENYLSNTFIKIVMSSDELILKQANKDGKLKDKKFTVSELAQGKELLKQKVKKSLHEMAFHNVETVIPMFKDILKCELQDLRWLVEAVEIRHDCAHRGGYTKDLNKVEITKESLEEIITKIVIFVREIHEQVYIKPKF
ncbi:hypothetical protein [Acinetobacter indicus]|uniref:hypothetical protein n=1 Tax=Acinetobacter indicus TaxID=756892 RepID=UPI00144478DD|nr:hypothetical protein [Acinetobacter indicus]